MSFYKKYLSYLVSVPFPSMISIPFMYKKIDLDDVVGELVLEIKKMQSIDDLDVESIPILIKKALVLVKKYKCKKKLKKEMVIKSLQIIIDMSNITGPLEPMVLSMIPSMVESIY